MQGRIQVTNGGGWDAFVARIYDGPNNRKAKRDALKAK
jgi:hypothetical protein